MPTSFTDPSVVRDVSDKENDVIPTIPNDPNLTDEDRKQRQFEISLAKTAYNYTLSYLPPVPLSADQPKGEGFSAEYISHLIKPFTVLTENFLAVVTQRLEAELTGDLGGFNQINEVEQALEEVKKQLSGFSILNVKEDIEAFENLGNALTQLPNVIKNLISGIEQVPKDLERVAKGLGTVFSQVPEEGVTAFLKNTLYDILGTSQGAKYLEPQSIEEFKELFPKMPMPEVVTLKPKEWMQLPEGKSVWQQDWYFGYMQVAGYNTTNLNRVSNHDNPPSMSVSLNNLLQKCPITDQMLKEVCGDNSVTLKSAAEDHRLYCCDFSAFKNADGSILHEKERYMVAPIALFYWNPNPGPGYPKQGALQPVAIQLGQEHDADKFPIFTPKDGERWALAKHYVESANAVQHESVAHFGACHMAAEAIVVATNRALPVEHPVLTLLKPHFRFTIAINDSALHSLVVPGGTVASVLSPAIESTLGIIRDHWEKWQFDEWSPPALFKNRGVDSSSLPDFPFRDDTLLLWNAIKRWVGSYLSVYYSDNEAVKGDMELQAWVTELASPNGAKLKGMSGVQPAPNSNEGSWQISSLDYLTQLVSQIIYLCGPQHASVNYAQFPLMSYLPAVSGSIYAPPPGRSSEGSSKEYLECLPPLDVALYQSSFGYLLSAVQYDVLGHYSKNPRDPYFKDERVHEACEEFKADLARAEAEIRSKNKNRPIPYVFQLPSQVPNSISI